MNTIYLPAQSVQKRAVILDETVCVRRGMDAVARQRLAQFAARSARIEEAPARKYDTQGRLQSLHLLGSTFDYAYDAVGRLIEVYKNKEIFESYVYNTRGQRTADMPAPWADKRHFAYNAHGNCVQAGAIRMTYNAKGNMTSRSLCSFDAQRHTDKGTLHLQYGKNTRLEHIVFPDNTTVTYHYSTSDIMPVHIHCVAQNKDALRFAWDGLRLLRYTDAADNGEYVFHYEKNDGLVPLTATVLSGPVLQRFGNGVRLHMRYKPCGTLEHVFAVLPSGQRACIKSVVYNAFGIPLYDSAPTWYFPIGFTGGLLDPFTGFVRLGVRDYDPAVGRFTCPDPARIGGRDNDMYDYCSDDPVNYTDKTGLIAIPLLFAAGSLLGLGVGSGGAYSAAWLADKFRPQNMHTNAPTAVGAVSTIAPMVGATVGVGKAAGAVTGAALYVPHAIGALDAALSGIVAQVAYTASRATGMDVGKIMQRVGNAKDFAGGFALPPTTLQSRAEAAGTALSLFQIWSFVNRAKNKAVSGKWDESEHPRDPATGKFIKK